MSTTTCTIVGVTSTAARSYHHGNLRTALLEGAEQTLAEGGDLSLRELARRVGVSHAAPRRHFADKQALLDALAEDGFEQLGRLLEAAAAGPTFAARLEGMARAYVCFAIEHAALLELMFAGKHRSPGLYAASERAFAPALALIAEGQANGSVVPGDTQRVALFAFAVLQGLAALANRGMLPDAPLDDLVADAVERMLLGLRPRTA